MSSTRTLQLRPARTVPATVVAVVGIAVGVAAVWMSAVRLKDGSWDPTAQTWAGTVAAQAWNNPWVIAALAVITLVGVVALVLALKPGRLSALHLETGAPPDGQTSTAETEIVLNRRSLTRLAVSRAVDVVGVDDVSAVLRGRRLQLSVTTDGPPRAGLEASLVDAVRSAMIDIGLDRQPTVTATCRTRK